jgi:hypothetical protein
MEGMLVSILFVRLLGYWPTVHDIKGLTNEAFSCGVNLEQILRSNTISLAQP